MFCICRRCIAAIMAGCLLIWPEFNFADEPTGKPAEAVKSSAAENVAGEGASHTQPAEGSKANPAEAKPLPKHSEDEEYELYKSLADTLDQVERNYVKPIDRRELMEAAIKGMLTKLDPYSVYIGPEEMSSFRTSVENQFGGIGIQVTIDEGQLKVISPLVGTPAYRAGCAGGRPNCGNRRRIGPQHRARRSREEAERRSGHHGELHGAASAHR